MVRRGGLAKGGQVATGAFRGKAEAIELADGADLVARVTVHRGVSANQRKPVLVLIDVVNRNLPAVGVVTKLALGAVLAAVQIGMAILTFLWGIAKDKSLVAIRALHFCVPAAQRKFSLRVGELEFGAQRLPSLRGMAILAWELEFVAVRAVVSVRSDVLA